MKLEFNLSWNKIIFNILTGAFCCKSLKSDQVLASHRERERRGGRNNQHIQRNIMIIANKPKKKTLLSICYWLNTLTHGYR